MNASDSVVGLIFLGMQIYLCAWRGIIFFHISLWNSSKFCMKMELIVVRLIHGAVFRGRRAEGSRKKTVGQESWLSG